MYKQLNYGIYAKMKSTYQQIDQMVIKCQKNIKPYMDYKIQFDIQSNYDKKNKIVIGKKKTIHTTRRFLKEVYLTIDEIYIKEKVL